MNCSGCSSEQIPPLVLLTPFLLSIPSAVPEIVPLLPVISVFSSQMHHSIHIQTRCHPTHPSLRRYPWRLFLNITPFPGFLLQQTRPQCIVHTLVSKFSPPVPSFCSHNSTKTLLVKITDDFIMLNPELVLSSQSTQSFTFYTALLWSTLFTEMPRMHIRQVSFFLTNSFFYVLILLDCHIECSRVEALSILTLWWLCWLFSSWVSLSISFLLDFCDTEFRILQINSPLFANRGRKR